MIGPLAVALSLLLGFSLVLAFLKLLLSSKQLPSSVPCGSMGLPFLGETFGYLRPHESYSIGSFLESHCSRYGRVFRSHLFGSPTIVSCDHDFNTFVLQNEGKLFRSSYPKPVVDIAGKLSIMIVSSDLHRKLRSVAVNFISTSKSRPDFLRYVEKLSISLMESWKTHQEVSFYKEAKRFTLYIMLKYVLDIEPEDPLAPRILEDFLTFMKGFVSVPLYVPGTPYAKAIKARARLLSTLGEIMRERKEMGLFKGEFLDEIMQKENLSDEERRNVALDILLAGYETTSGLLGLVIYFTAKAPSVLQKLKEEHQTLRRGKKDGEPLSMEDYKQMEFTSHVISEALRCGNLVKFVHRKAIQDVQFKEYLIPAGWKVLPVLSGAHLDPSLHQNPSEFDPSRWVVDQTINKKVAPFGGGSRLCPGVDLARVETAFFLHHLVLNYGWKTKGDESPISCPYLDFKRGLLLEIDPTDKPIV
ncbi:cytochrome P450 724B1 [Diospyros lotus]|uniref:cytochrome P450 724B1 n=1 Tax=Diospyros lotus TaxID=55363 RepID=UPI002250F0DD|nr:cytochrome P450 724B1 [Diospyros lotus]